MRSSPRKIFFAMALACSISIAAAGAMQAPAVAASAEPSVPPAGQPFYMCLPDIGYCLAPPATHGAIFMAVYSDNPSDWARVSYTNPYYYAGHDWYELTTGGECLNWDPTPNVLGWQPVYADSCVPGDANELWYPDSGGREWVNLHGNIGYGVDTFLQLCCAAENIGGQEFIGIGANTGTSPSSEYDGWSEPAA